MWLAIRRRCWTVDCLRRYGLQNQEMCVFLQPSGRDIDHILLECAVTAQFWGRFVALISSRCPVPSGQPSLQDFWLAARTSAPKHLRKNTDCCIILVSSFIWKERNQMIFNNIVVAVDQLSHLALQEYQQWRLAAAH